jgi:hypothetical protein
MRYSDLSNNMMISELWTTITIQIQYNIIVLFVETQTNTVVKQVLLYLYVDKRAAHMTDITRHHHAGSIPDRMMIYIIQMKRTGWLFGFKIFIWTTNYACSFSQSCHKWLIRVKLDGMTSYLTNGLN